MARIIWMFLILISVAAPARADDISAAGRSVVRVVVIAFEDGEVSDFGHGSGFAVAPNRIVTNAHVVALAAEDPKMVVVGVVPPEGSQALRARVVAVDPARDLALIEVEQGEVARRIDRDDPRAGRLGSFGGDDADRHVGALRRLGHDMGVGHHPVRRDREARVMAEARHVAVLEGDDDDADDRAAGGADVVGARRRGKGEEGEEEEEQAAHRHSLM